MYDEATVVTLPLHHRVREGIRHPGNWLQLGRYGVVGLLGYIVNNAVFALAVHVLAIDFRVASVIAFLVSVTHNFIWNRHWTFDARDGHAGFQAARFFTVSLAAFGVTFAVLNLLVSVAHLPKVPANALAVIAGVPLSFLGQKLWSFKR
jgi:dolichol-phosphate mannosyltransferase